MNIKSRRNSLVQLIWQSIPQGYRFLIEQNHYLRYEAVKDLPFRFVMRLQWYMRTELSPKLAVNLEMMCICMLELQELTRYESMCWQQRKDLGICFDRRLNYPF